MKNGSNKKHARLSTIEQLKVLSVERYANINLTDLPAKWPRELLLKKQTVKRIRHQHDYIDMCWLTKIINPDSPE